MSSSIGALFVCPSHLPPTDVNGKYNEMKSVLKNLLSDLRRGKESGKKI